MKDQAKSNDAQNVQNDQEKAQKRNDFFKNSIKRPQK